MYKHAIWVTVLQRKCPLTISKWRKVKTWTTLFTFFLRFFELALQKTKKSHFWGGVEKT